MAAVERARAGKARSALVMIAKAEKMRAAEMNGVYLTGVTDANINTACTATPPGNSLACYVEMVDIAADVDWNYTVTAVAGPPATFLATATKAAGLPNAGETITLDQAGTWAGTFTP